MDRFAKYGATIGSRIVWSYCPQLDVTSVGAVEDGALRTTSPTPGFSTVLQGLFHRTRLLSTGEL